MKMMAMIFPTVAQVNGPVGESISRSEHHSAMLGAEATAAIMVQDEDGGEDPVGRTMMKVIRIGEEIERMAMHPHGTGNLDTTREIEIEIAMPPPGLDTKVTLIRLWK